MNHDPAVPPADLRGLVEENRQVLDQLCRFLAGLSSTRYGQPLGAGGRQSLGKHVRHIIDHYAALLATAGQGRLDYEHRQREEWLERCPREARRRLEAISLALDELADLSGEGALILDYPLDHQSQRCLGSTLGRELAFLTSHTVHHMALLGLLAERLGVTLPETFGVHPSTLRHWAGQAPASA